MIANARINANLNPRLSGCCAIFPLLWQRPDAQTLGGGTAEMYELLHTRKHYWSSCGDFRLPGRELWEFRIVLPVENRSEVDCHEATDFCTAAHRGIGNGDRRGADSGTGSMERLGLGTGRVCDWRARGRSYSKFCLRLPRLLRIWLSGLCIRRVRLSRLWLWLP